MKLLIIEDNTILRENIAKYFQIQWYTVDTHNCYTGASYKITTWEYDVIVLDLWLWEWEHDGLDICTEIRNKWNTTPIIMLTARTQTNQKIEWLNTWADDYLTKPFDYWELLARVQALSRRDKKHKWNIIQYGDIEVDKQSHEVRKNNINIQLSKLEYDLLIFLLENVWVALKKEYIIEKVWWDIDMFQHTRKLDIYISYLRKKIDPDFIETIHWVWYILR